MILVTGASGLVGSHLLMVLTKNEDKVVAIYRNSKGISKVEKLFQHYFQSKAPELFKSIKWVQGDLLDLDFLNHLFKEYTFSKVYHCAAFVSFHRSDFEKLIRQNREGTANVVNYSLKYGVKKLAYVSSTAAVGKSKSVFTTENDKWDPESGNSGYSISKFGAEKEVWRGIEEGLPAVIVNPCVILGPGNWNDSSLTLFKTIEKGLRFYPSGSNAVVDVRDVAFSLHTLMESNIVNERFLCVGTNITYKALFDQMAEKMNAKKPSIAVPRWLAVFVAFHLEKWNKLIGKKGGLTYESARTSYNHISYSSEKLQKAISITFHPLDDTLQNAIEGRTKS